MAPFRPIHPMAAAARDMPMGKGNGKGKDMVKGWGYETGTRTFEQQVKCEKKRSCSEKRPRNA